MTVITGESVAVGDFRQFQLLRDYIWYIQWLSTWLLLKLYFTIFFLNISIIMTLQVWRVPYRQKWVIIVHFINTVIICDRWSTLFSTFIDRSNIWHQVDSNIATYRLRTIVSVFIDTIDDASCISKHGNELATKSIHFLCHPWEILQNYLIRKTKILYNYTESFNFDDFNRTCKHFIILHITNFFTMAISYSQAAIAISFVHCLRRRDTM